MLLPIVEKRFSTIAKFSFVAFLPEIIPHIPSFTRAGVFGITLITFVLAGKFASMVLVVSPAAIETISFSLFILGEISSKTPITWLGLTAIKIMSDYLYMPYFYFKLT